MPEITMPRLSDTMEEGTIARWLKQPGDPVAKGDVLAEIETDKAVMDLEAYEAGVLERVLVQEGETVPIGQPVAVVGSGAGVEVEPVEPPPAPAQAAVVPEAPMAPTPPPGPAPVTEAPGVEEAGRKVKASPMARAVAREHGIDLAAVAGSGPGGRIVRADVEALVQGDGRAGAAAGPSAPAAPAAPSPAPAAVIPTAGAPSAPSAPGPPAATVAGPAPAAAPVPAAPSPGVAAEVEEIPLTNMRKVLARRLVESMQSAPHFYLTSVVDAEALIRFRSELNEHLAGAADGLKLSVNDLLVKACATALRDNPAMNVSWGGDKLLRHNRIHIGIAVALDTGLIVPVIRDADHKRLRQISAEAKALAARARSGKLTPDEFTGGTFTISNLGIYGIDHFTAVINPPESAILAVGATSPEPVVREGEVTVRQTMKLTLSIDHRALDGATAARFLQQLGAILEEPLRIVV